MDVKLKNLRYAGIPMLATFLLGASFTVIGAILSYYIVAPQTHHVPYSNAVAGMYTGTYIGGSANLNAIGLQYGVRFAGALGNAIGTYAGIFVAEFLK